MSMTIREQLFALQDREYQKFQQKLIPNLAPDRIIGVRTPELRRLAKQISDAEGFKKELPHAYFEEDQLHSFLVQEGAVLNGTHTIACCQLDAAVADCMGGNVSAEMIGFFHRCPNLSIG